MYIEHTMYYLYLPMDMETDFLRTILFVSSTTRWTASVIPSSTPPILEEVAIAAILKY